MRATAKRDEVAARIRAMIASGDLAPGARVPPRTRLVRKLGVAPATLQLVMDELVRDGFVVTRGRAGTFVAGSPPHLSNFALVFPLVQQPGLEQTRLYDALMRSAFDSVLAPPGRFVTYRGVDERRAAGDDRGRLIDDIRARRLAGVIYAGAPWALAASGAWDAARKAGTPAVAFGAPSAEVPVPCVNPDSGSEVDRAREHLAKRGHRRIAWFVIPPPRRGEADMVAARLGGRGIAPPPHLVQQVPPQTPWAAQGAARALMELPEGKRPTGIAVLDDNLVRDVTEGLAASGARAPDDVEIVAHANFPDRPPAALTVRYIGFDAHRILREGLAAVRAQRARKRTQRQTLVPAVWEDELPDGGAGGARA